MGCGCGGGGTRSGIAYKVTAPDGTLRYTATVGEARVVKASIDSPATVVMQVPVAEMEAWQAKRDAAAAEAVA